MSHAEYASSLRLVAEFYEKHPEVPLPNFTLSICSVDTPEEIAPIVRAFGHAHKKYGDSLVTISRDFGSISLEVLATREKFCTRVVTGTRHVEEKTIPAKVIPAHEEEIYEWECPGALLKPNAETLDAGLERDLDTGVGTRTHEQEAADGDIA